MAKEQNPVNNGPKKPRQVADIIGERVTPLDRLNKAWAENRARNGPPPNLGESEQEPSETLLGESEQETASPNLGESEQLPAAAPSPPVRPNLGESEQPSALKPGVYANPHDRYTYEVMPDGSVVLNHPVTGRTVLRPSSADPRVQSAMAAIKGQIEDGTLKAGASPFQLPLKTSRA